MVVPHMYVDVKLAKIVNSTISDTDVMDTTSSLQIRIWKQLKDFLLKN